MSLEFLSLISYTDMHIILRNISLKKPINLSSGYYYTCFLIKSSSKWRHAESQVFKKNPTHTSGRVHHKIAVKCMRLLPCDLARTQKWCMSSWITVELKPHTVLGLKMLQFHETWKHFWNWMSWITVFVFIISRSIYLLAWQSKVLRNFLAFLFVCM